MGVAERGRDSVGGRCGLIVIGKAPRVFQLFPIRCTRVREQVTRKVNAALDDRHRFSGYAQNCVARGSVMKIESRTTRQSINLGSIDFRRL